MKKKLKKMIFLLIFALCALLFLQGGGWRAAEPREKDIPILLYHNLGDTAAAETISTARFAEHMQTLRSKGYQAVSFEELLAFVNDGATLPDKPVVITFDDGYESNYTLAYPILKRYHMKATIFVIGVSMGKRVYKDTGKAITPHFTAEQAEEMEQSGLLSVQSHGYDLHQVQGLDKAPVRQGILQQKDESLNAYEAFLQTDFRHMCSCLGKRPIAFAYPYGKYSGQSERILKNLGIPITVTTEPHSNTVKQGDADSLRKLGRFSVNDSVTAQELLLMLRR